MVLPSQKIIPIITACLVATGVIVYATVVPATGAPKVSKSSLPQTLEVVKSQINTVSTSTVIAYQQEHNVPTESVLDKKKPGDQATTTTMTNQVALDLFTNYINLKNSGQAIDDTTENQLIQSTLDGHNFGAVQAKIYSSKDIKTVNDDSVQELKTYATIMGGIFARNSLAVTETELVVINNALTNTDPTQFAKLTPMINSYKKIVSEMLKVNVPVHMAGFHLDLINGFSGAIESDEDMKLLFSDPTRAIAGLKEYEDASIQIADSMTSINKIYSDAGISFNSTDSASLFLNITNNSQQ